MLKNETFTSEHLTVIKPQKGWQFIDIKELVAYKDLLRFLVIRGIKAKYAQSVLGVGWAIIQPLFTTILITFIFGNVAGMDTGPIPKGVFFAIGVVPWTYFSNCLVDSSNSLVVNAHIITKVYFPRLVLPISSVISKLLDLGIMLMVLIVYCMTQGFYPNVNYLLIIPLTLLMLAASSGIGMILSSMAIQYRDVKFALTFLTQLLIYTVPVAYPTIKIPEPYRELYAINPMVGVIETFRVIFTGHGEIPVNYLVIGTISTIVVLVFGAFYFKRMEKSFADVA